MAVNLKNNEKLKIQNNQNATKLKNSGKLKFNSWRHQKWGRGKKSQKILNSTAHVIQNSGIFFGNIENFSCAEFFAVANPSIRIIFNFRPGDGISKDWAILELQGDLKSHSESSFEGKFIGDLHFTKTGTPVLIIGHHLMFGKEMKIDKPLALLEKKNEGEETEYIVKTIITRKILFKTRPKPIVSN